MNYQILIEKICHATDYLDEVRGALKAGDHNDLARQLAQATGRVDNVKRQLEGDALEEVAR